MTAKEKEKNIENMSLDEIITNYGPKKYHDLVIAMKWAYHLKSTEEYKDRPASEIIEKALKDVFTNKVSEKEVLKAEEKDEEVKEALKKERRKARKEAKE